MHNYFVIRTAHSDGMANTRSRSAGKQLVWSYNIWGGVFKFPDGHCEKIDSPVVLDLANTGVIESTGEVADRDSMNIGEPVEMARVKFDIDGGGKARRTEWLPAGRGYGFLIDDRDGKAATDKSGKRMFGSNNEHETGFHKLAVLDTDGDGVLRGAELEGLKVWVDNNGDGNVQSGELKTLAEVGVTEVSVTWQVVNFNGLDRLRSWAVKDGKKILTEDMFFWNDTQTD